MKHILAIAATALFSVVGTGCNTTWNTSQKESISHVGVGSISSADDSYHKPDPTKSPEMQTTITTATGGGFIPSLIGSAIDANAMAKQRKRFESSASEFFPAVAKLAEVPPEAEIERELIQALKEHSFFSSKISDSPTDIFNIEVIENGFIRAAAASDENMFLVYEIVARVTFTNEKDTKLLSALVHGSSRKFALIDSIAQSPELASQQMAEAIEDLVVNIMAELDRKLYR